MHRKVPLSLAFLGTLRSPHPLSPSRPRRVLASMGAVTGFLPGGTVLGPRAVVLTNLTPALFTAAGGFSCLDTVKQGPARARASIQTTQARASQGRVSAGTRRKCWQVRVSNALVPQPSRQRLRQTSDTWS